MPGRLSVSCRLSRATVLGGDGPATGELGGGHPRSQPVAHHRHPAHTLPAQPLLQYGTDCDQHPGPTWQPRGPPVLSGSQPGPGGEVRRQGGGGLMCWGMVLGSQKAHAPGCLVSQGGCPSQTPRTWTGWGSVGLGHLPPTRYSQSRISFSLP